MEGAAMNKDERTPRQEVGWTPARHSRNGPVSGMDDQFASVMALIAQQPAGPEGEDGVTGFLRRLCAAMVPALAASGAGLSVMADNEVRGLTTASDPAAERIEELQFVLGEGPCIDAFATRRPVLIPDLSDGPMRRWPGYTPSVYEAGVRAVFAFPLQVGAGRLGALDVFRARPGPLTADELRKALTFAEVAVTTLLDGQSAARPGAAAHGLSEAVNSRAELFQAQGMVMIQLGIPITDALARMRAYAYAENRPLADVARDIVARRLRFDRHHP
jgi:GAF domain-containing protein